MKRFAGTLTRRLRVGRMVLPTWSLVLAALLAMAAAAGQAVGPVLSGSVTGTAGVTAEQAILLSTTTSDHSVSSHAGDDALVVVNDEGTSFTAAIEMHVGDTAVKLKLAVRNASNDTASGLLTLEVPEGLDVEVEDSDGVAGGLDEAQYSANTWLLQVTSPGSDTLNITIEPKDDAAPGFYVISGSIVQISG